MSTPPLATWQSLSPPIAAAQSARGSSRWALALVAVLIGLAFFFTEHALDISLADAYTQTADEMEVTALGGNGLRRIIFLGIAGLGLWLVATARNQPLRVHWPLAGAIGGYLAISVASYLWSVDRGLCLRRLIVIACCTLAALGIARRFTMRELCLLVVATIGPLTLIGVLAELRLGTFRPWSGDYRFSGSVHPNTQGMYLTTLALASLGLARSALRGRTLFWTIFAASFVLLILTKSRTGTAATMVAFGVVFLLQTSASFKLTVGILLAGASVLAAWLVMLCGIDPLVDFYDALLLGRAEESDTLSGRAFIWPAVGHYIAQRPWLGYGYESFWNPGQIDVISDQLGWGLREAHNGYLDVLLSTGIVGLTCAVAAISLGFVAAVRGSVSLRDPAYALPVGLLVFGVLSSCMESGMVNVMFPPFLLACSLLRMALFAEQAAPSLPRTNDR
ncbi:MAG: O-antigen ligase family protein [Pirellulaceae bacterium]|nr:O-antigen ligase family protein [Pirellulaceae bacterium]